MARGLRIKTKEGHYKLFWVVAGVVREEIYKDRPLPFFTACREADTKERTTHKIGQIDVVHADMKAADYKQLDLFRQ
jgi:hypothetical protein